MNQLMRANSMRGKSAHVGHVTRTIARLLAIAAAIFTVGVVLMSTVSAQSGSPSATSSMIVKLVDGLSVEQQAAAVDRNGGTEKSKVPALRLHVIEVSTDQLDATLNKYRADPQVIRAEVNKARKSDAVPADPLYSQQWSLPKINWDLVFGSVAPSASVVVAVLDTGIDATHPDLNGNVVAGTSILDGSNGMTDPSGHGTRVAGIVAARTNTTPPEGIAGVAYAGVRLMPVTVLDAQGLGQDSDVIAGVIWAADNGADVILMAFSNPDYSESLQEAIDYAWSKDVVLVAAVGNSGVNAPSFPAGDRGVMGVSATDDNDQFASFSNYGPSVFLAAPGTNILTTDVGNAYSMMSGTSSSAAIVAGAAAQLWAFDPTLTNGIIVGRLARSADAVGTQDQTGNGRINFARAALDTGTDFIQPAGSAPVGGGGPFVGPYRAAATNVATNTNLNAMSTPLSSAQTGVTFSGVVSRQNSSDSAIPAGGSVELQFKSGTACNGGLTTAATATINAAGSFGGSFTAPTAAGTYSYQAQYQGASQGSGGSAINWQKSVSGCQTITVNAQAATSLVVASASGTYGGTANLSATLTSGGTGVSGKTISFLLNGNSVGSATTNGSGAATLSGVSLSAVNAGTYPTGAGATFTGDAAYQASNGNATLTVNAAATSTSISAPTITYNANGSVTVTVTSTAGAVTGNVSLSVGGGAALSKALASGSASFTNTDIASLTSPNAGDHALNASYAAQGNFAASSASGSLHVNQASSTTTVSCPASVPYTGAAQTPCSATVTGVGLSLTPTPTYSNSTNAGTAAASYTYAGDANHIGSSDSKNFTISQASSTTTVTCLGSVPYTGAAQTPCTATANGVAGLSQSLTVSYSNNTNAGTATANATFAGDTNHTGSNDSKSFTIDKATSSTSVSSSKNPATADDNVSFTATVTPGATGNVRFLVNGGNYGAQVVLAGGAATIAFTNKNVGTYTVTASYLGDTNYSGSSANLSPDQQVTSGAPAKLAFDVQPTDTQAGQAITPAVTVRILDAAGNLTASTADVTVATGLPDAFTASSTTTVAAVAGVATFADLHINKAGTYTIGAASTGTTVATSNSFNVTPGVAVTFGFNVPASITAGQSFDITVTAKDQFNNTATSYAGVVHFTSSDPHAVLPADTMFAAPDHGVKTIVGQTQLQTSGNQTITATDTVATSPTITGTSATITVNPGNATVLVVTAPAATEMAGVPFDVTVELQDAYGNTASGYGGSIHFDITDPKAETPANYTFVLATDHGVHTFSVTLHSAGQFTVKATDVSSSFYGVSGTITVQPGPPAKLAFQTQPGDTFVDVAIPDFKVEVHDADDNLVDSSNASIKIAFGNNPTGLAVLSGTATVNAVNGVATFSGLKLNKAATGYTLVGSSGSLATATSNAFNVGKGTATLSLSNLNHTYDGSPKSATVTTTPAGLIGVAATYDGSNTAPMAAGSYAVVASLDNPDYQAANVTGTLVIDKAASTTTVTFEPGPYTYRGSAYTATAVVTGVGGLNSSVAVVYSGDCTNVTAANGCTATATFAGDTNHNGSSDNKSITITKASSTTTATFEAGPYSYRGSAFTATVTVTGIGGLSSSVAVVYSGDCANVTAANGCTATATYAGDTNHLGSSDNKSITISKASSTTTVTFEDGPYTYRATPFTATAKVTGVGALNNPLAVVYSGDCTNVASANGCTATATFAGDQNHDGSTDNKSITITKAGSTTTVAFESGPYTYRSSAFTATAVVTGAGGLSTFIAVVYSGDCANVTSANGCTATATFAGDTNHNGSTDSKSITITKASSTTIVTFEVGPYTYRGYAFTATATVTGVGGLSNSVAVVYSGDCTNVTAPNGCTATATFGGDTNHLGSIDNKSITIAKAASTTAMGCPTSVVYSGSAQTPCTATVNGIGGLNLAPMPTYASNIFAGTATASYTYAGDTNHNGSSDSRTFTIDKAASATVVTVAGGASFTYDGVSHPATVSVTGVGGLGLAFAPVYSCGHAPIDAADSGCTASYGYAGDANHTGSAGSTTYTISKKSASVTPNSASKFSGNGDPVPLTTGVLSGFVASENIVATYARTLGETPTVAGSAYTIGATLSPAAKLANYNITSNTASFYILAVNITGPVGPIAKGNPATVTASFLNSGTQAAPNCTFDWDDGSTNAVVATGIGGVGGNWTCSLQRTFAAAGVYEVKVTITDANTGSTTVSFQYVVIYDASAGFVTGGGWINSPPGAYAANPVLVGKANFGFVSKYKSGQSTPTGETEFQFSAAGFNFHSTVYDWLVIAGAKAQYKGSGTINDAGDYGFMLTATDGKVNNGGGVDKFRIKVWNKATGAVMYDNNMGGSDDIDSASPQALGGGSITVHK